MSHNIDHIFYINLEKRTDKRELIEAELHNFGLVGERFDAIYDVDTASGCSKSHLAVLKLAKSRGYKNVIILEDDFTFLVSKEDFETELAQFFAQYSGNFDVCMLSYNMLQHVTLGDDTNVNKVVEAQTASGYLVNSHYYDKLIDLYERNIPLLAQTGEHWNYMNDQCWKPLQRIDNWFYFKTRLGKQRAGISDNTGVYCDYGV